MRELLGHTIANFCDKIVSSNILSKSDRMPDVADKFEIISENLVSDVAEIAIRTHQSYHNK